jgi:hypothetical protein
MTLRCGLETPKDQCIKLVPLWVQRGGKYAKKVSCLCCKSLTGTGPDLQWQSITCPLCVHRYTEVGEIVTKCDENSAILIYTRLLPLWTIWDR